MIKIFKESIQEFKSTRNFVTMALLCALNVVLSYFSISISDTLKLTFSYLTMSIIGMLFGPACGGLLGILLDNIKWIVNPSGPYLVLFGITEMLAGVIYGVMLYKKEITIQRCFITKLIINVSLNIFLTPLWLHILYGGAYWAYVTARVFKNLVMWPIESVIMYFLLKRVKEFRKAK